MLHFIVRGLSMPGSVVWVDGSGAYGKVVIYVFNGLGKKPFIFVQIIQDLFKSCFIPFQTCSFPFRLIIKFLFGARVRFFIHELFIEFMSCMGMYWNVRGCMRADSHKWASCPIQDCSM